MRQRSWSIAAYTLALLGVLMLPGLVTLHQIPQETPLAPITFEKSLASVRSLYPHSQILTGVPDVLNHQLTYRYRIRTPGGHLRHVYIATATGRILANQPLTHPSSASSTAQYPTSLKAKAIQIASQAVGGGQVATVRTVSEDHGKTYIVELMLTNGQYAKIHVNPQLSEILSVQLDTGDH
ncbi:hypothetical protein [Sulfobacillus thermosulfidooxidans]|uniref:hypothetical protein n=1 Tax=Sulfobacillus thermosulfidooxidans TaxID=28034 RepID=UPI00117FFA80|nr:hypothetical protein [Sulfobacillus thermosulfidooxidans]